MSVDWTGPWSAPAKLNLFLHVLGRRDDGYHRLQTVFQMLDWGDRLYLRRREDGAIVRSEALPGVSDQADLCLRAARLLKQVSGVATGCEIRLDKRLPMGAGLGGGSSDAATVLRVLDRLWGLDLGLERLAQLALGLGADVPVFLRGDSAFAEGVGEMLTPVAVPPSWYVIVVPPVVVSTASVFQDPALTRNTPPIKIESFLNGAETRNDCQPLVAERHPQIAEALAWLGQRGRARLTGTGCAVFAPFDTRGEAEAVATDWDGPGPAVLARGLQTSPLIEELQRGPWGS